jgi:hypothetical protein
MMKRREVQTMTNEDYESVGFLHDARINLMNAQSHLPNPSKRVALALRLVKLVLNDARFYVSVTTDTAWIGSDGMYVDYGTYAGRVGGGERLSHFVRPLPETVEDFLAVLADIAGALPDEPAEE